MIGEGQRGATLESLLTKVRMLTRQSSLQGSINAIAYFSSTTANHWHVCNTGQYWRSSQISRRSVLRRTFSTGNSNSHCGSCSLSVITGRIGRIREDQRHCLQNRSKEYHSPRRIDRTPTTGLQSSEEPLWRMFSETSAIVLVLKTASAQWSRSIGRSWWEVERCFDRSFQRPCDTSVRSDSQRFVFGLLRLETELRKRCSINREFHARVSRTLDRIPRKVRFRFQTNLRKLLEDNREKRSILLESLVEVNEGNLCETLKATIPFGIAYHHSGLTGDGNAQCALLNCSPLFRSRASIDRRGVPRRYSHMSDMYINIIHWSEFTC